jgi:glycerophosphoryl diester phosphodiesterase
MLSLLVLAAAKLAAPLPATAPPRGDRTATIHRRILDPDGGQITVAHRGCHNPAPGHALGSAPENSAAALDNCVALGVDVMETDVRQSRDGVLVIIHDATLDRMTDGHGPVEAMTLAELKALRLRANQGGPTAPLTDQSILTLDEMLVYARGKIVLNLDVKTAIYGEVVAAVLRAHAVDAVIVKTTASTGTAQPLAAIAPFDRVPFMPVLRFPHAEAELQGVMRAQLQGTPRPIGFELPPLSPAILPALSSIARGAKVRLWINTLNGGYVSGMGGDPDALRNPDMVWGSLYRTGVSMIQTDEPEALVAFNARYAATARR